MKKRRIFKQDLTSSDLMNLEKIFYENDYFILVKKDKNKKHKYRRTFITSPASERNWLIFKSVFFKKKVK